MDKRTKKRIKGLRDKIAKVRQRIAGELEQPDDPGEVERLRDEIRKMEQQIEELKNS